VDTDECFVKAIEVARSFDDPRAAFQFCAIFQQFHRCVKVEDLTLLFRDLLRKGQVDAALTAHLPIRQRFSLGHLPMVKQIVLDRSLHPVRAVLLSSIGRFRRREEMREFCSAVREQPELAAHAKAWF
jgi:hypothetical protein